MNWVEWLLIGFFVILFGVWKGATRSRIPPKIYPDPTTRPNDEDGFYVFEQRYAPKDGPPQ